MGRLAPSIPPGRFAVRFLVAFPLLVLLYLALEPAHQGLVLGVANGLMAAAEPATVVARLPDRGWRVDAVAAGGGRRFVTGFEPFVAHLLLLGLPLGAALVVATPGPLRARLHWLGRAVAAIVLVEVASVTGLARGYLCLQSSPGDRVCLYLLRLVFASGQLGAVAVWAALTWRYWLGAGKGTPTR
jgi:hypothetical protein